jgi:hypothetical protein
VAAYICSLLRIGRKKGVIYVYLICIGQHTTGLKMIDQIVQINVFQIRKMLNPKIFQTKCKQTPATMTGDFCSHHCIIIIGSTALGGPWP